MSANHSVMRYTHGLSLLLLIAFVSLSPRPSAGQKPEIDSLQVKGRNYEVFTEDLSLSNKAIGGNVFVGTAFLQGNLSEYFSNTYYLGINLDFHFNRLVLQVDDYIGFGSTKQDLNFDSEQTWESGKAALSFMLGGNVGYALFDSKLTKIVPLAGIGATLLSSTFFGSSELSDYEPFLPHYKLGMYVDLKSLVLLQDHVRVNDEDVNYTSLRLSFGMTDNLGSPKFSEFYRGATFYISIGMGGLSRAFERSKEKSKTLP